MLLHSSSRVAGQVREQDQAEIRRIDESIGRNPWKIALVERCNLLAAVRP